MFSNLIVSQQKFVLFVDNINIEQNCLKILENLLRQQGDQNYVFLPENIFENIDKKPINNITLKEKTNILLRPLSDLLIIYNPAEVFRMINLYKKNSLTKQLFLWATVENISEHFVIPFLEYMADIVVTFTSSENLTILNRKPGGSVVRKNYNYTIDNDEIKVNEKKKNNELYKSGCSTTNPEQLGTFKIGLKEKELVAKNSLKLPFEKNILSHQHENLENSGKIIYTPDIEDDIDEEDPDDDLYI